MNKQYRNNRYVALAIIMAASSGCSSGRPPLEKMSVAEQALKQAEGKDARRYSPLEMQLAYEKIEEAEEAIRQKDYEVARRFAEKAEIDALAAEAKADSMRAQAAVAELKEGIETLKRELKYKSAQ